MTATRSRSSDREIVRRSLRGSVTAEQRRTIARDVSTAVKSAVSRTIQRNRRALQELAEH